MTRSVLALLSFLLTWGYQASNAAAAQVTDLIAERAMPELDHLLPANGELDIRMADGLLERGEFIKEFWIDPDSGQFIANVVSHYGETHRVWGVAVMTVTVPVPAQRLAPDHIIQPGDLTEIELPHQRVGAFALQDKAQLVGQQVRRMLMPGRPVPRQSVTPPVVIERGQKVLITLTHRGLSLTAKGRAMADAHDGQTIRVVNLSSNKTITGVAKPNGVVEVLQ